MSILPAIVFFESAYGFLVVAALICAIVALAKQPWSWPLIPAALLFICVALMVGK